MSAIISVNPLVAVSNEISCLKRNDDGAVAQLRPIATVTSLRLERERLSPTVLVEVKPTKETPPFTESFFQGEVVPKPVLTAKLMMLLPLPKVKVEVAVAEVPAA